MLPVCSVHRKGILAGVPQHRCLRPDITDHCRLIFTAHLVQYVEDGIHNHTAGTVDISFQARHFFLLSPEKARIFYCTGRIGSVTSGSSPLKRLLSASAALEIRNTAYPTQARSDEVAVTIQGQHRVLIGVVEYAANKITLAVNHSRCIAEILAVHRKVIGKPLHTSGGEGVGFVVCAAHVLVVRNHFLRRTESEIRTPYRFPQRSPVPSRRRCPPACGYRNISWTVPMPFAFS